MDYGYGLWRNPVGDEVDVDNPKHGSLLGQKYLEEFLYS